MREGLVIGSGTQPSSPTAPAPGPAADRGLCAFWLTGRRLGLDLRWVGGAVALDAITRVPDARPAVRGLFNLRGEPIVVLDLAAILDLGGAPPTGKLGLVLRTAGLAAVIQVERVESVVPP